MTFHLCCKKINVAKEKGSRQTWTLLKFYTQVTSEAGCGEGIVLGAVNKIMKFKETSDQASPLPGMMLSGCQNHS